MEGQISHPPRRKGEKDIQPHTSKVVCQGQGQHLRRRLKGQRGARELWVGHRCEGVTKV